MSENIESKILSNIKNMEEFSIEEQYDILNAKKLLQSDILDDSYKGSLIKYLKKGTNGKVKVNYKVNDIGRLNIKVDGLKEGESCIYHACMWRQVKSALCSKYYYDLDIVNAHPVFLLQVYKKLGYKCPNLEHYVNRRDEYFEKYEKEGLSRDAVKTLAITIIYGGSLESHAREHNIDESKLGLFKTLNDELNHNSEKLLSRNDMLKYRMRAFEIKGQNHNNINGTAMSYFLQTLESNCLMTMYKWLISNNYKVGALIHDGLHIVKEDKLDKTRITTCLEQEILDKTDLKVELKFKNFEKVEGLNNMIVIKTDKEGGDYISDKLKNDYVISHERIFMRINNVWTENDKVIKRNLIKVIGGMDIFMNHVDANGEIKLVPYSTMSKGANAMLPFVEPTEDPDFIDKLWTSNLYKLCFKNGFYDFKSKELKEYDRDTHTTIKINREYKPADPEVIQQVYDKILNPIFNNDKDLMNTWLNFTARGLAGHIEDKNWGVGFGERDCGKGVVVGMLENCFGEYCRSTNSENFLFKKGQTDSAKSLSWLVPFEFKRLLLTNEITTDAEGKYRINGNILKKLSSGGDKIEARVNHKDEINFKIQAKVCMFCNDLPPIEPADTKETSYMFRFPSKFLNPDDDRLGKPIMRPVMKEVNGEIEYEYDEEGNKKMINVCSFYKKDDTIKKWCTQEEVMNAFIQIIFDNYSDKVAIPESMKEDMNDFKEEEREEDKFMALFNYPGDKEWVDEKKEWVSIDRINMLLKKAHIALSPQKYKNYLEGMGCFKSKRPDDYTGKRVHCWIGLQVNENKVDQLTEGLMIED